MINLLFPFNNHIMFSAPDCAAFDGGMFRVAEKGNDTVTVANWIHVCS